MLGYTIPCPFRSETLTPLAAGRVTAHCSQLRPSLGIDHNQRELTCPRLQPLLEAACVQCLDNIEVKGWIPLPQFRTMLKDILAPEFPVGSAEALPYQTACASLLVGSAPTSLPGLQNKN